MNQGNRIEDNNLPVQRIAVISKSDASGGGASKVAEDLAVLLNGKCDIVAHHWVGLKGNASHSHTRKLFGGRYFGTLHKWFRNLSRTIGLPDFITPEVFNLLYRSKEHYDIYHFHDISGTFSPIAMRWLAKRKPVVWTFHDCSPFTGGCLYPMDCQAFKSKCTKCPQLKIWPLTSGIDRTGFMQNYKRKTALQSLFTPMAPSQWMADEAMASGMFQQRPEVIPYSVDTSVYRPLDKRNVRDVLGLPRDSFTAMISAWHLHDRRKGTPIAVEAIRKFGKPIFIIAVGQYGNIVKKMFQDLEVHFTGYINDARLMAQYYASADVFLFPTLADNLPNSILESMSCGTPTIAFKTGGVPDMVHHDTNGWLAEKHEAACLIKGLKVAFESKERVAKWAQHGLRVVQERYTPDIFLNDHLTVYRDAKSKKANWNLGAQ